MKPGSGWVERGFRAGYQWQGPGQGMGDSQWEQSCLALLPVPSALALDLSLSGPQFCI